MYKVLFIDENEQVLETRVFETKEKANKYIKQEVKDCDGDLEGCRYEIVLKK